MPLVTHVVGARPNFMKAAPVIRALEVLALPQSLVHTGQHYSDEMSDVFFRELELPRPDVNLGVGSGSHGAQTGAAMVALEAHLTAVPPTLLLVYGDVNSTLAAALVAAKLRVPFAHVEAGLRSFDRTMPEEINRVVADALADLLFTTSPEADLNLLREGVEPARVHFVGNTMIDTLARLRDRFDHVAVRRRLDIGGDYAVATIHRPGNVDGDAAAEQTARALTDVSQLIPVIIPLHPRGRAALRDAGLREGPGVRVIDPLGYVDFMSLVLGSRLVVTDSGGVQEETTVLGIPCLTLRPNTERPITITHGTNRLADPSSLAVMAAGLLSGDLAMPDARPPLWDGNAAERIGQIVVDWLRAR
jgi:UDP-N-acetylglucosamine 2-epimerase (non-hydrolysing)